MKRINISYEKYIELHNKFLEEHPLHRCDMIYSHTPMYGLTFNTKNKVISREDKNIFEEISLLLDKKYKLIEPS